MVEKYNDLFIETKNPETGEMTAYGISLANSQILKDEKAFGFDPIASVCLTTTQKENSINYIRFLLGE